MLNSKTYKSFKWWQKVVFWTAVISVLNFVFWIYIYFIYASSKGKSKQEKQEKIVKGIYYWSLFWILLIVAVFVIGILYYFYLRLTI